MDVGTRTVKFSEIKQDAHLADLYSKIYTIPKSERVKVLMSWLANAYSDLLIPFLSEAETLSTYTTHVRLLDTFANNSSYDIVAQLASEFSEHFLTCQVLPNLLESDKTADITYYIQVLCENLTCPSLIRKLMDLVTTHLTSVFISRMVSDDHLVSTATLSLIKSLLEFYCEDLWYDLILQYLLPMKHLLTSQRQKMLPEIEFHESTEKLLEMVPNHVVDIINHPILAEHFLLYFQDEVMRLRFIDSAIAVSLPSSRSELRRAGLSEQQSVEDSEVDVDMSEPEPSKARKSGRNPTYPMWIFKYDGTDFLHALRRGVALEEEEGPESFFEDDLFSVTNQLNSSSVSFNITTSSDNNEALSRSQLSNDENNFELANLSAADTSGGSFMETGTDGTFSNMEEPWSLEPESLLFIDEDKNPPSLSNGFAVKDKRKSMDQGLDDADGRGPYFGPFLQSLYAIMGRWTELHPDVLFTATEIISVLASSRIPLVNTLFLDITLTLQPSYPSFSSLLHSIRSELDNSMRKYPDLVFRNVWKSAARDSSSKGEAIQFPSRQSEDPSPFAFVNTLKRTIAANRSFRMTAEEVDRTMGVSRRSSSFRALSSIFKSSRESTHPSEFRLLNKAASSINSEEEEQAAKIMSLRSVLFTHWMLEMGAIAMQLCWGRKSFHGNHQRITGNGNNDDPTTPPAASNGEVEVEGRRGIADSSTPTEEITVSSTSTWL